MGIVNDLLPNLYSWRIRDLENEMRWSRLHFDRTQQLKKDEQERVLRALNQLPAIRDEAKQARNSRLEAERTRSNLRREWDDEVERSRASEQPLEHLYNVRWLSALEEEHRLYQQDSEASAGPLDVELVESKGHVDEYASRPKLQDLLARYITAIEIDRNSTLRLGQLALDFTSEVRDTEIVFLDRMSR